MTKQHTHTHTRGTHAQVLTVYQIRSSAADAPGILKNLELAAENNGEGLYMALKANGVPLVRLTHLETYLCAPAPRHTLAVATLLARWHTAKYIDI